MKLHTSYWMKLGELSFEVPQQPDSLNPHVFAILQSGNFFFASQLDHLARMCWLCIAVPYLSIVTEDVTDMGPVEEGEQKWVGGSPHGGPEGYGLTPSRLPAARADVTRSTWTQSAAESQEAQLEMRIKETAMLWISGSISSLSAAPEL